MKVFVTGATGYIGGSVAERLKQRGHQVLGLARTQEKAALLEARGIEPLVGTLEQPEVLYEGARRTDATINAANSDHVPAAMVLVEALAESGKRLIQTSGSSIICDDAKGAFASERIFPDDEPFVPIPRKVPRVSIDRLVRAAGVARGIRATVICPTMIYGKGLGLEPESDQLPKLFEESKRRGKGVYIGPGLNRWSNVYIGDLADLYLLVLEKAPAASFFFAENGEASLKEVAATVSHALGFGGSTESWKFEDALAGYGLFARYGLATNSRVRAVNARNLGWHPTGPSLDDAVRRQL